MDDTEEKVASLEEQIVQTEEELEFLFTLLSEGIPCHDEVVRLCRKITELELRRDGGIDVELEVKAQDRASKFISEAQAIYEARLETEEVP